MPSTTTPLTTDPHNANKGTARGRGLLEQSLRSYGAGRSALADKHGVLIAGNGYNYGDNLEAGAVLLPPSGMTRKVGSPVPAKATTPAYIYVLCDPDTNEVRYVGKTDNPYRRFHVHLADCDSGNSYVKRWVRSLKRQGKRPVMTTIEFCDHASWADRERYWIAQYRSDGARLTNTQTGGRGGTTFPMSDEGKRKISQARLGMKFSTEHRAKLSCRKQEHYASHPEARHTLSRYWAAITDEQVMEVWRLAWAGEMTQREIAERYGIPSSSVSEIKHNKRYLHVLRPERPE